MGTLGEHIHHPSGDARDTTMNLGTSAPQHILGLGRVASNERTNDLPHRREMHVVCPGLDY
jgi:hypothetical protein